MERIYPLVQEGNNPKDVLLSLSKIFFYEVDYKKIPKLNLTIQEIYPAQINKEIHYETMAKIRQSIIFKVMVSELVIFTSVFGGIYLFKYPITSSEYWLYLGNNAVAIVGIIMTSTIAVVLFFYRGKQRT